jgi:hypothetical protein
MLSVAPLVNTISLVSALKNLAQLILTLANFFFNSLAIGESVLCGLVLYFV